MERPEEAYPELDQALAYELEHNSGSATHLASMQLWTGVALSQLDRQEEARPLLQAGRSLLDKPHILYKDDLPIIQQALARVGEEVIVR